MSTISKIKARQVLDSRGNPTVEVDVHASCGAFGRAIVPSGASTGSREALELRDTQNPAYLGKSVQTAVNNVNTIIGPALIGVDVTQQTKVDELMIAKDGTENKSKLGANAILGVSMAVTQCAAESRQLPLYQYIGQLAGITPSITPVPMMNVLNGGAHANNTIDFQEFMIMPTGAQNINHAIQMGTEIFHHLKTILKRQHFSTAVGDEGGFAPSLKRNEDAISVIIDAIEAAGFSSGRDVFIALDVAASEFYENQTYVLKGEGVSYNTADLIGVYQNLCNLFPIVSIEDGLHENDWDGWKQLTTQLGNRVQLVGDDLFVTNAAILERGIQNGVGNAILIKLNQIGTVSETIKTIQLAQQHHYRPIISHRSGESEDTFIADLAVGMNAGQIKTGSLCRTDRTAKYNQLIRIESDLDDAHQYYAFHHQELHSRS
jgi:enolase